jgi:cytochrome c6
MVQVENRQRTGPIRVLTSQEERNMRKTTSCIAGVTVAAVALAAIALLSVPAKADTAAAEATYKAKCAMCHGPDGKGETATGKMMKVKDFSSEEVQKMSDADLSSAISSGKGKMAAFKTLSADQVKDLVAYVRAFGKKK